MIKITKEQKIYGAVLALAALALLCDRAFFQPAVAEAHSSADLLIKRPTDDARPGTPGPRGAHPKGASSASSPILGAGRGLAQRLVSSAKVRCVDVNCPDDAFALAPIWWATTAPEIKVIGLSRKTDISDADHERAAAFARHRLDAVIIRGQSGYVIIDKTEGVYVGETFEHFKLVSVTKTSATFVSGPVRVELRIQGDSKLKGGSGVIENTARETQEETKQKD
jgi:hypothetical protein